MNQTLIIVPTVNERENLPRMAQKLLSLPVGVDVLVVDGNSTDETGKIADELAAKHPQIQVLHEEKKNGLGRAYISGFKWALERNYEFIFEMDCDLSHDPDEIPNFLKAAQNADLVLGSRYTGGVRVLNWPLKRLLLSRLRRHLCLARHRHADSPTRPAATNVSAAARCKPSIWTTSAQTIQLPD